MDAASSSASDASSDSELSEDKLILTRIYENQPAKKKQEELADWLWYFSMCVESMYVEFVPRTKLVRHGLICSA